MKMNTFLIKKHEDEQRKGQRSEVRAKWESNKAVAIKWGGGRWAWAWTSRPFLLRIAFGPSLQNVTMALTKPTS